MTPTVSDLKAMLFKALEQQAVMIEFEKVSAKLTHEKFRALVREGFTEEQAIRLCQRITL